MAIARRPAKEIADEFVAAYFADFEEGDRVAPDVLAFEIGRLIARDREEVPAETKSEPKQAASAEDVHKYVPSPAHPTFCGSCGQHRDHCPGWGGKERT